MSNSDGRIYLETVGGVKKGISINDLQTVLGSGYSDIGGIIVNGNINKWAKNKPFRNSAVGFAVDVTKSTPELRSPDRLAQALIANYGLVLPRYNASDFKTHYSDEWTYQKPRGKANNEWFRMLDFDGYIQASYFQVGPISSNGIQIGYNTIFNGYLSTPRTSYIFPGDLITFYLQCKEDPDTGVPGSLFPYDFYRGQVNQNLDDISQYYIGIGIITGTSNPTLWVKTGDQLLSHISSDDLEAYLSVNIPNSITTGDGARIIPLLCSQPYATWDNAPGSGQFIGLNGAYITRNIGSASQKITMGVAVSYSSNNVTMVFTLTNNTSSDVILKNLVAFISSAESFYNEGDSTHNPPTTQGYGIRDYLYEHWDANSAENVPPFTAMGLTNPPDIYLSDWVSGLTPPAYLVGVGYNAYPDFRTANSNSTTIRVGQTVTWTKVLNIGQGDGCGYYADGVFVSVCAFVNMSAYIEEFTNLTD